MLCVFQKTINDNIAYKIELSCTQLRSRPRSAPLQIVS